MSAEAAKFLNSFAQAISTMGLYAEGHPARETILSYCGVPVMNELGVILGTLCHYDVVPRDQGKRPAIPS